MAPGLASLHLDSVDPQGAISRAMAPERVVGVLLFLAALRVLQDYVIYPRLIKRTLYLHPLAVVLALWAGALWAFGWRLCAVAAVYFGTNYLSPYGWTGGAILRYDWLAARVLGIALLRRERPAASGFLLAWATALRIFPGCLIAGVALGAAWRMLRARSSA